MKASTIGSPVEQLKHTSTMVEQKDTNKCLNSSLCEAEGDVGAARAYQRHGGIEVDELRGTMMMSMAKKWIHNVPYR